MPAKSFTLQELSEMIFHDIERDKILKADSALERCMTICNIYSLRKVYDYLSIHTL